MSPPLAVNASAVAAAAANSAFEPTDADQHHEILAYLATVKGRHRSWLRKEGSFRQAAASGKKEVKSYISETLGRREGLQDCDEVDDSFFGPQEAIRGSVVKLSIATAGRQVRKLGSMVKRGPSLDVNRSRSRTLAAGSSAVPSLVVVDEEGGGGDTTGGELSDGRSSLESPNPLSPTYSHLSLNDSPNNSSDESLASNPQTPSGSEVEGQPPRSMSPSTSYISAKPFLTLPAVAEHPRPSYSRKPSNLSITTNKLDNHSEDSLEQVASPEALTSPFEYPRPGASEQVASSTLFRSPFDYPRPTPSRTLTLDESLPKPRRRDSRSDFTHRRKRSVNSEDLSKMFWSQRRRKRGTPQAEGEDRDLDLRLEEALVKAGAAQQEQEKYEVDVVWENQRGFVTFGSPHFSNAALTQLDPKGWTDSTGKASGFTPRSFPLPSPFWEWDHSCWLVDMSIDCDEHGWQYAWRFRSSRWRGVAKGWRCFVRRRRWIRGRIYRPMPLLLANSAQANGKHPSQCVVWPTVVSSDYCNDLVSSSETAPGQVVGLKAATAVLPLSADRKNDIFGWEQGFDAQNPFLAWSVVRNAGDIALRERRAAPGNRSDETLIGTWRDAVIEINYHRAARILRHCRLDRERLNIWKWWLGQKVPRPMEDFGEVTTSKKTSAGRFSNLQPLSGFDPVLWKERGPHPALEDVWDLVEGRLDAVLQMFEFQTTRCDLLSLILNLHPVAHALHRFHSWDNPDKRPPDALSPDFGGRLDFYRDVQELKRLYEGAVAKERAQEEAEEEERHARGSGRGPIVKGLEARRKASRKSLKAKGKMKAE